MDQDIASKLTNYSRAMGVIKGFFFNLAQKHSRIKAYETIVRLII